MKFPLKQHTAHLIPAPDSLNPRMRYIWHLIENSYKPWGLSNAEMDDLLAWYRSQQPIDFKSLLKTEQHPGKST